ncbi:uncharacterized protein BJX67DRAFT_366039 [Aspergillus lucknowensis]|uniref:Uncharacterized protein n=1 Tax=Aspergillus lucknowensis TaxID=176173 RepID=A0ABR4LDN4_9EURO
MYYHQLIEDSIQVMNDTFRILREAIITMEDIQFCGRQSKNDPESTPVLTLLILATTLNIDPTWLATAGRLLRHLESKGFKGICVEIADPTPFDPLRFSPVRPTNRILGLWDTVRTEILRENNLREWTTLGCFRIGKTANHLEHTTTVFITVKPTSDDRGWRHVREKVVTILERHKLSDVAVLIQRDEFTYQTMPHSSQTPFKTPLW